MQHEKQICIAARKVDLIQEAYDAGNVRAANKHTSSLHTVGGTTNGERPKGRRCKRFPKGPKEATAKDENHHRSRPPSGKVSVGTAGSEL